MRVFLALTMTAAFACRGNSGGTTDASGGDPYPQVMTTWGAYGNAVGYAWALSQTVQAANCGSGATAPCTIAWSVALSPGVLGGGHAARDRQLALRRHAGVC